MTESHFETLREFTTALDKKVEVGFEKVNTGFEKVNTGFTEVKGEIKLIQKEIVTEKENFEKRFGYLGKLIYAVMAMIVPILLLIVTILIKLFN